MIKTSYYRERKMNTEQKTLKILMREQVYSLLNCALRTSSFGLLGSSLEMQNPRSHPIATESEPAFTKNLS